MTDRIVIIGAGYAGMTAAATLEKNGLPFTLINRHPYHYFTTLLHEAAGGRGAPADYAVDIREVLRQPDSQCIVDEVTAIDRTGRAVRMKSHGDIPYDWLVVTLGWVPEYFGIPGLKEHSLVLTNLETAREIRAHIETELNRFLDDGDPRHLRILIGGGGLTGVELTGELLDWLPGLCAAKGIPAANLDLQIIEAMPHILPQVPEALRSVAVEVLTQKGAKLRTQTKIVKVEAGKLHLEGGEVVEAGTIVWTGGVRANPLLAEAGFTCDRRGRAKVNEFLQSVDDPHVFIGGDAAWAEENGKPLPPTAQVATQMGPVLAANLMAVMQGRPMRTFHFHNRGTLASLGADAGVGDMMGIGIRGAAAALAKEASKVKYLLELGGLRLTAIKTREIVTL
jgi:NADH dehydrogenase